MEFVLTMLSHEAIEKKVQTTAVTVAAGVVVICALLLLDYAVNGSEESPEDPE